MAEFAAIYGRRRVGKTYLIRRFFENKDCIFFQTAGIHKGSLKKQLDKFKQEIETTFYKNRSGLKLLEFRNWHAAFQALTDAIEICDDTKKIVIFLDEVPWLATAKSGLIEAIDYYWNRYWSDNPKIKLILCGSAASWIIKKILNDTGGLHNRVSLRLRIEPFSLAETKSYLDYKKVKFNEEQILTLYMCLGGVPFYLNFIEKGLSAIQNVNAMCFQRNGSLYDEFNILFISLFKKHEIHKDLIIFIAHKRYGVSRQEIEYKFNIKGGRLTERLKELEEAGFIHSFIPYVKERGIFYKVIDEYSLFYLTWIHQKSPFKLASDIDDQYWNNISSKPAWHAWSGYSFESVCFKHLPQIKKYLNVPNGSETHTWRVIASEDGDGAQIDLIFDRPDGIINLCEIKYSKSQFIIDKKYAKLLEYRENIYRIAKKTYKQIFHSFITVNGVKKNQYSNALISSVITIGDLFKDT